MFRRFAQDRKGSIGAVLALGSVALLGAASASLDYTRMTNSRAALAAAVDAAALAGAQAPVADMQTIARQVFDASQRLASLKTASAEMVNTLFDKLSKPAS